MKKLAFLLSILFCGAIAANASQAVAKADISAENVIYCKVINDTGAEFQYKVGSTVYTIEVDESEPFAFDEGTQILRQDESGNWVNWFVFSVMYSGQSVQLSSLL